MHTLQTLPDDITKPINRLVAEVEAVVNSLADADTDKFQMNVQTLLDDLKADLTAILSAIGLQQHAPLTTRDTPVSRSLEITPFVVHRLTVLSLQALLDNLTAPINMTLADIEAVVDSLTTGNATDVETSVENLLDDLEAELKHLFDSLLSPNATSFPASRDGVQTPANLTTSIHELIADAEAIIHNLTDARPNDLKTSLQTLVADVEALLESILQPQGLQQAAPLAIRATPVSGPHWEIKHPADLIPLSTQALPQNLTEPINIIVADAEAVVHSLTNANTTDLEPSLRHLLDDLEIELEDLLHSLLSPNATSSASSLLSRDGLQLPANLTTSLNKIVADVEVILHGLTDADSTQLEGNLQTLLDDVEALLNGSPLQKVSWARSCFSSEALAHISHSPLYQRDDFALSGDVFKADVMQIAADLQTALSNLESADAQKIEGDVEQLVNDLETLVQAIQSVHQVSCDPISVPSNIANTFVFLQRDVVPSANVTTQIEQILTDVEALLDSLVKLDSTSAQAKFETLLDDLKALLQLPNIPGTSGLPSMQQRSSLPLAEAKLKASFDHIVADAKAFLDDFTSADITQAEADFEKFVQDVEALLDASQY